MSNGNGKIVYSTSIEDNPISESDRVSLTVPDDYDPYGPYDQDEANSSENGDIIDTYRQMKQQYTD